jgi:sulfoxide reductase heme-binding subunit YedZ
MGVQYTSVIWNRQKKRYDLVMIGLIALFMATFAITNLIVHPEATIETLLIRMTGTTALVILHIILVIGPLCRINSRFLPLLYNRRHLGVTLFLIALAHAIINLIQFHGLGDTNPILSIFTANPNYGSFIQFPFQVLGFMALVILFLMAATSHDFWLHNLGTKIWKGLHMMVYFAYALLILHVVLGVVQLEKATINTLFLGVGMIGVIGLHLYAGMLERQRLVQPTYEQGDFIEVCPVDEIEENRAKVILVRGENIAIFKYEGQLSAVNNVCKHQNGPLGEGKIVDGCITCPWHGYQYLPNSGQSPPPFQEKVATYSLKIKGNSVWVNPQPHPEGTRIEPVRIA